MLTPYSFFSLLIKAFIFDFDGVVVDSERLWRELGDKSFYPSLIPGWTMEDGGRLMGLGAKAGYELLVADYGLTLSHEEYEIRRHKLIDDIYAVHSPNPLPGLEELLERLQSLQIAIGIGSSANREWIDWTLSRLGLEHYFPIIACTTDVGEERAKPAPDIYLLAAERLNVDPKDCVVIEDSYNGIVAAKSAGMKCIGIRTDMNPEQDLSMTDLVVKSHHELTAEVLMTM